MSRHRLDPVLQTLAIGGYRDDGCALWGSCLRCPLPRCALDVTDDPRDVLEAARDLVFRRLSDRGWTPAMIAARTGASVRTVYRAIDPDRPRAA